MSPRPTEHCGSPTPRSFPGPRSTPIFHKPGSIKVSSVEDLLKLSLTVLTDLAYSRENMTLKLTPQCHQFSMQGGRCQIKPTPWVSSVTYPVKPTREVRPCLDVRDLNKTIIWENHKPQTMEEITHQLAGAVVFTKADALKAFLQVPLTE